MGSSRVLVIEQNLDRGGALEEKNCDAGPRICCGGGFRGLFGLCPDAAGGHSGGFAWESARIFCFAQCRGCGQARQLVSRQGAEAIPAKRLRGCSREVSPRRRSIRRPRFCPDATGRRYRGWRAVGNDRPAGCRCHWGRHVPRRREWPGSECRRRAAPGLNFALALTGWRRKIQTARVLIDLARRRAQELSSSHKIMLGLRMHWSQLRRFTCFAEIFQFPSTL